MKFLAFVSLSIILFTFSSCFKGESVDTIIHNARIHTMNEGDDIMEAIAIKDGKIIEVGPERQILNKYSADEYIDAELKDVYPGFTDAHTHIMSYARLKLSVDLVGCKSYDEMIERIIAYQKKHHRDFVIGRGWDQSLWNMAEMPDNKKLSEVFPDIPVCLFRIDGHALMANDFLIQKSSVYNTFEQTDNLSTGGYFVLNETGEKTGVLVDNAMNPVIDILPDFPENELMKEIIEVQEELFGFGVTGIHEAGLQLKEVKLLEKMIDDGKLDLNIYGMLLPTEENKEFAKKNGIYTHQNLLIRSFKVYGDGALGSRGAFLKAPYTDKHDHYGYLVTNEQAMKEIAQFCREIGYQMNTHAIGDSTNKILLDIYENTALENQDHRWRIEHAQVVDPKDIPLFAEYRVFPSVQPTHATSDMRWAESRLGKDRMTGAYAYRSLMNSFGMIALGTDFPVEYANPYMTIYSAVARKNSENEPEKGFMPQEALTLDECLMGMTIWPAMASFQENELGTIEKGKDATLFIVESPITIDEYRQNFAYVTMVKGKKVYSLE